MRPVVRTVRVTAPRRHRPSTVVTLLTACVALPVIALVMPNTMQYVLPQAIDDLGLSAARAAGPVRADGLALPALLLTVPPAGVLARRYPAWLVLLAGLCCVLAGELAARYATSVPLIGAVRSMQGVGGGLALPATLVLVWERRRRVLVTAWAGLLTAALVVAMPLALYAVPDVSAEGWREVLRPYPVLVVAAVAVAMVCAVVRIRAGGAPPAFKHAERTQLLLPLVPAAGFAFLAVVTTYGWSPGAQLVVAAVALAALLALAVVGSRDAATGSPLGFAVVMLTMGLLTYPVVTPLAGLLSTNTGPHGVPLTPFAAGAGAALAGALAATRLSPRSARGAVLAGHGLAVVALLGFLTLDAGSPTWRLTAPLIALGAGVGLALAASLREAGLGSVLFGLSLCLPAVLTGQIAVLSLQTAQIQRLGPLTRGQEQQVVDALTAGYRLWLIAAGMIAVLLAATTLLAARPSPSPTRTPT